MNPSVSATQPMVFSDSMGKNPFVFPSGMLNHDTQPIPWASNPFSFCMLDMSFHFPYDLSSSYVNPSFGPGGMMPPYYPFSFGGSHIPQPNLMVGGWDPPSSGPNPRFTFTRLSSQMGRQFTYYIMSFIPSSSTSILMNIFIMVNPSLSFGVSYRGSKFYSMGNPLHGVLSFGGNIYPHMSNPYHATFSSQATYSVMIPLKPFMNQLGRGYYPSI
jgi:hypothetical protein